MINETMFNASKEIYPFLAGTAFGGILVGALVLALLFVLAFYIYFALAWSTIAKKLNHRKPWLAWIPIANGALILQLGGFSWAWIFLILIPVLGWLALLVLMIVATWKTFERRKYPGWLSLSMILPYVGGLIYLISIGFVAWGDKEKPKRRKKKRR